MRWRPRETSETEWKFPIFVRLAGDEFFTSLLTTDDDNGLSLSCRHLGDQEPPRNCNHLRFCIDLYCVHLFTGLDHYPFSFMVPFRKASSIEDRFTIADVSVDTFRH